jgi:hypothetical protein
MTTDIRQANTHLSAKMPGFWLIAKDLDQRLRTWRIIWKLCRHPLAS